SLMVAFICSSEISMPYCWPIWSWTCSSIITRSIWSFIFSRFCGLGSTPEVIAANLRRFIKSVFVMTFLFTTAAIRDVEDEFALASVTKRKRLIKTNTQRMLTFSSLFEVWVTIMPNLILGNMSLHLEKFFKLED